jgi:hypothetical protein
MALSDIVTVTISTSAPGVTQAGFGIPLIAGYHTHFDERVRFYTSLAGMISDGFVTTDPFYKAAAALQAQTPCVPRWAVGRCALAPTQVVNLTPAHVSTTNYGVTIGSDTEVAERFDFTSDGSATVQEIVEGLVADIGSSVAGVTATEDNTKVILTGSSGKWFSVEVDDDTGNANGMGQWTVKDASTDPGIATDLAAILTENSTWYGLILVHRSEAIVNAAASWVESNKKLMVAATSDTDARGGGSTDLLSDLESSGYLRTAGFYHHKPHQFPDAAWMGNRFPFDPGSETWAHCALAGIDKTPGLTASERANIKAKHANYYVEEAGLGLMFFGWTGGNEWIDTTRFVDWVTARMSEGCVQLLANASAQGSKIPMTDSGIAAVEKVVRGVLEAGIKAGGLTADPAPVITVPLASDISSTERGARTLPAIHFSAQLAGAIHELTLTGVLGD